MAFSTTNPWKGIVKNFSYTRQDSTPIVFVIENADPVTGEPDGSAKDITGRTYKMEGDSVPAPLDETGQLFALVGVVAVGTDGRVSFTPAGGAGGDMDPTGFDVIFFDVVETTSGTDHSKIRGEIELDPRITDKGI